MQDVGFNMAVLNTQFDIYFNESHIPMYIKELASRKIVDFNPAFNKVKHNLKFAFNKFEDCFSYENFLTAKTIYSQNGSFLFQATMINDGLVSIQIIQLFDENTQVLSENDKVERDLLYKKEFLINLVDQHLFDFIPLGIIYTDKDFNLKWNNHKTQEFFGRKMKKGFNFIDAIYVDKITSFWNKIDRIKNNQQYENFNFTIRNHELDKELSILATVFKDPLNDGFVFFLEDHTEKTYFSQQITQSSLQLNQINHELDKFLYSVSHNIRGPVASLEGLMKVIEISTVQDVNELKHHLRLNLRLLNSFVNDISNVATNIHTHVKFEELNLFQLVEKQLTFLENIYEIQPIKNIAILSNHLIKSDADRLGIVIKSILKNSFQYKDPRKEEFRISISVGQNEDFHLIEIMDNGIGIADKVKPKIFDMFFRGTELSNGNGMGLYNSREILKKIGGTLNIDSENNQWTKVKIYLPVNI